MSTPCGVCVTSGWNWTPKNGRVRCRTAAYGQVGVLARILAVLALCGPHVVAPSRDHDHGGVSDTGAAYVFSAFAQVDCNENGIEDACEIDEALTPDCNCNQLPDECELAAGSAVDEDANGVIDACETDCDDNGVHDALAVARAVAVAVL